MILWLSFADPDRPKGQQLLGVSLIEIESEGLSDRQALALAIMSAWRQGANPGGEVLTAVIPPEKEPAFRPHLNRLMQPAELTELFGPMLRGSPATGWKVAKP